MYILHQAIALHDGGIVRVRFFDEAKVLFGLDF
jgi:hypothetical protein